MAEKDHKKFMGKDTLGLSRSKELEKGQGISLIRIVVRAAQTAPAAKPIVRRREQYGIVFCGDDTLGEEIRR